MRIARFRLATLLCVPAIGLIGCGSSTPANTTPDVGTDPGADVGEKPPAAPYEKVLFDATTRIGSDSSKPNFQTVVAPIELTNGPFEKVTMTVELSSTCFPFEKWKTNPPPAGHNWPADCDAFDRNFEMTLTDPSAPKDTPAIEITRAITPFGGPLTIEQDVTDIFNVVKGKRDFSIHITTYSDGAGKVSGSNGGWNVAAKFAVKPGKAPRNVLAVIPLMNTNIVAGPAPTPVSFTLPPGTVSSRIEYRTTGHGGADGTSTGCSGPAEEFCLRTHKITLDGAKLEDIKPYRRDCSKLCTLVTAPGPGGAPFEYCKENPCGDVRSVKASRANWCPGSLTPPVMWEPATLNAPGTHTFGVSLDKIAVGGSLRTSVLVFAYGE